ncbi:hypothetical protein MMC16_002945 [Acarospora aff. strigata]|nr:hypothetical protein [Acarospora aff. strigata]
MASVESPLRFQRLPVKTSEASDQPYTSKHASGQDNGNQSGASDSTKSNEDYFGSNSQPFPNGSKLPKAWYTGGGRSLVDNNDLVPTPPVNIPQSSPDSLGTFLEESNTPHNTRYAEPSPLECFIRERSTSINFNSQVTLDTGHKQGLKDPLPKKTIRQRPLGRSLLGALSGDKPEAQVVEAQVASPWVDRRVRKPEQPLVITTTTETVGCGDLAELEPMASLTSESTASSASQEACTPVGSPSEYALSPISTFSPLRPPTSFQESSAWPAPRRSGSSRPKSYTYDKSASLRNSRRRTSLRSSSTASMSPASAFLSMWGKDEVTAQPDDEGQEVGDYVLGKQIGFGGFSVVREAYTIENGERMQRAVKIVRKQVPGKGDRENEQVQAEFEHEVGLWRCLIHRHILPLIAVYETNFATFCFTPLNTGGTLFDVVRSNRKGLNGKLAKRYAYQLAEAIRYLHEDVRVIHRDIKLENCLVDRANPEDAAEGGNILLCDFGMSEFITSDTRSNSPDPYENATDRPPPKSIGPSETSTSVIGSLQYAAPELIMGPAGVRDTSVDIWAFGVVVYALLVGNLPFNHPLPSKVQKMILAGEWSQTTLSQAHGIRQTTGEAVELVRNCLDLSTEARWDIAQVLNSRWLQNCGEMYGEIDSAWAR